MKIPKFIKKIVAFCDPESSRYALGAVKCESRGGVAHVVATDGRSLTCVSFEDDQGDIDSLVMGKEMKAIPANALPTANLLADGMVESDYGGRKVPLCEGRFPDYERVLVQEGDYTPILLDPALLKKLCEVHEATADSHGPAGNRGFVVWFSNNPQKPIFTSSTHGGYTIRSVLMPMSCDSDTHEWPARREWAAPAAVEPPTMKAVIGTKRTRKAKVTADKVPSVDAFAGAV